MLSTLQEKIAQAHGLAIAGATVTAKLVPRTPDAALGEELSRMHRQANELRSRCLAIEGRLGDGLADEVLAHANSVSETASDLVGAWFKAGTDPVSAWTFLAMGEAAEVSAWTAVSVLAAGAADMQVRELAEWALPMQEEHLLIALEGVRRLARALEPHAPRFG